MTSWKVKKVVIPVAGLGTRFLPATKAVPKELLPIVDTPVVQYLVEEAVASGIQEVIFVISPDKETIRHHFSKHHALERQLLSRKKHDLVEIVRDVARLASFSFVYQHEPRGDAHAILCAKRMVGDEPFAVLYGDDVVDAKTPVLKQLLRAFEKYRAPIMALERLPREVLHRYGVVGATRVRERTYRIAGVVEKPSPREAPSNLTIVGKYVLPPRSMGTLEKVIRRGQSFPFETRLTDFFLSWLAEGKPLYGVEFRGERFDCGDKLGYVKAQIHFAMKRKDLSAELRSYLKKIK